MSNTEELRIAWLLPSISAGAHWQPILSRFLQSFNNTFFFTTEVWKEFDSQASYAHAVRQLGKIRSIGSDNHSQTPGYHHGYMKLPFNIIYYLAKFKPQVIISNSFSVWSIIAVMLKPIFSWKIIILYEGSTPGSDFKSSRFRTVFRRFVAANSNAFVANNNSAVKYLTEFLRIESRKIIAGPYLLPEKKLMENSPKFIDYDFSRLKKPIFLFIGQIIKRKGIYELVDACAYLNQREFSNYTLLIVGGGQETDQLKEKITKHGLSKQVLFIGRVDYDQLGVYFRASDVFIMPTFEDTWGMVTLEAMTFEMPVLGSKYAGSSELISDGVNGFLIDPFAPSDIAEKMSFFLNDPKLSLTMGANSRKIINQYSSDYSNRVFKEAIKICL